MNAVDFLARRWKRCVEFITALAQPNCMVGEQRYRALAAVRSRARSFRRDDRAIAPHIAWSFAVLVAIALLYGLTDKFFDTMHTELSALGSNQTAQTAIDNTAAMHDHFLLIALMVSILGAMVIAVYRRQRV